jgi:hypothetical protein
VIRFGSGDSVVLETFQRARFGIHGIAVPKTLMSQAGPRWIQEMLKRHEHCFADCVAAI